MAKKETEQEREQRTIEYMEKVRERAYADSDTSQYSPANLGKKQVAVKPIDKIVNEKMKQSNVVQKPIEPAKTKTKRVTDFSPQNYRRDTGVDSLESVLYSGGSKQEPKPQYSVGDILNRKTPIFTEAFAKEKEQADTRLAEMMNKKVNESGLSGKVLSGLLQGEAGYVDALAGIENTFAGLTGNESKIKSSSNNSAFQKFRELRAREMDNQGFLSSLPERLTQVGTQMLPSLATGGMAGIVMSGTMAGGQNAESALREGATPMQALLHGVTTGVAEGALEKYLGFVPGLNGMADGLRGITKSVKGNVKEIGKEVLRKSLGEGLEEVAIEPITQLSKRSFYDDSVVMNPSLKEFYSDTGLLPLERMAESGALGAIMGGTLTGVSIPSQLNHIKNVRNELGNSIQFDLKVGYSMPEDSESFKMATFINENPDKVGIEEYQKFKDTVKKDVAKVAKRKETEMYLGGDQNQLAPIMQNSSSQLAPILGEENRIYTESSFEPTPTQETAPSNETYIEESPLAPPKKQGQTMPIGDRTFENVGKKNIPAYQQQHPEVKEYYQFMAWHILNNGEYLPAEKGNAGDQTRELQGEVMKKLKETGLKQADIEDGLRRIQEGTGLENVARAKKIEAVLDDLLSNGFTSIEGDTWSPEQGYIDLKSRLDERAYTAKVKDDTPLPIRDIDYGIAKPFSGSPMQAIPIDAVFDSTTQQTIPSNDYAQEQSYVEESTLNIPYQQGVDMQEKSKNVSKFYENTLQSHNEMTEEEKALFPISDGEYAPVSESESTSKAYERLERDFDGELERLKSIESLNDGVDFDVAMGLLSYHLSAGKTSEAMRIAKMIQQKGSTKAGQLVQAHAKYTRTPEGMLLGAISVVEDIQKQIENDTPVKLEAAEKNADLVNAVLKEVEKEAENNIGNEIEKDLQDEAKGNEATKKKDKQEKKDDDASAKLAEKIIKNADNFWDARKQTEVNVIDAMVTELYNKHKESLPSKQANETTAYSEIAKAIKERSIAKETWIEAKKIVMKNYASQELIERYFENETSEDIIKYLKRNGEELTKEQEQAINLLQQYFGQGPNPPFAQKTLSKSIRIALKELNINFGQLVKDYYATGQQQRAELVEYIIAKTGLEEDDARALTNYVQTKIKDMKKEYSEKYLEGIFRDKKAPESLSDKSLKDLSSIANTGGLYNIKFSEKLYAKLETNVKRRLKEKGISVSELIKKGVKGVAFEREAFIQSLREDLDLRERDIETITRQAEIIFDDLARQAKQRYLNNMFRKSNRSKRKSIQAKMMELINLDALSDENILDRMKEVEGIPTLNQQDISKITEIAEIMQELDEGSYYYNLLNAVVHKTMADKLTVTKKEKLLGYLRISMLSAPTTYGKNILSNVTMSAPIIGLENFTNLTSGAMVDFITSKALGTRRTTNFSPVKIAQAQARGFVKGIKVMKRDMSILRMSKEKIQSKLKEDGLTEEQAGRISNILAPKNLYEKILGSYEGIDTSRMSESYELGNKRIFNADNAFEKTLNILDNAVKTALRIGDVPFYESAKEGRIQELKNINKSEEVTEEMLADAGLFALDRVFQNNSDMKQRLSKLKDSLGIVGDITLPFVQTPANIFDKLLDYGPVGIARGLNELGKRSKGKEFDQKYFVDRLSRGLNGTGLLMLFSSAVSAGLVSLTGSYDKKEKVRANESSNYQRYSVKIGGKYYSFEGYPPIGAILAMAVELDKVAKEEGLTMNAIYESLQAGGTVMLSNSMLKGLFDLTNNFNLVGATGKTATNFLSQLNPNIMKRTAKLIDPWVRETYDPNKTKELYNGIIAKIPFASKTLPKKVDVAGNETKWNGGVNGIFQMLFNPVATGEYKPTKAQKLVYDIFKKTGEEEVLYNVVSDTISYQGEKIILNTEQYIKMQSLMGKYTEEVVNELMNDDFEQYSAEEQIAVLKDVMSSAKEMAREQIIIDMDNGGTT